MSDAILLGHGRGEKARITIFFLAIIFFGFRNGNWSWTWNQCEVSGMILSIWTPCIAAIFTISSSLWMLKLSDIKKQWSPGWNLFHHLMNSSIIILKSSAVRKPFSLCRNSLIGRVRILLSSIGHRVCGRTWPFFFEPDLKMKTLKGVEPSGIDNGM